MQTNNIEQLKNSFNFIQNPVKEIVALNVRTLQNFSYIKAEELKDVQAPEDILEKNMDVIIHNGHMALDYIQEAFNICEKNWLSISDNLRENTELALKETKSAFSESVGNHPETR